MRTTFLQLLNQVKRRFSPLSEKVDYLVIGTHSRSIEGQLFDTLVNAGWLLEVERPAILHIVEGKPIVYIDGVQGWVNPNVHSDYVKTSTSTKN